MGAIGRGLLLDKKTEITDLASVRRRPLPLPGGAARDLFMRAVTGAMLRADEAGRPEPLSLRLLNRIIG